MQRHWWLGWACLAVVGAAAGLFAQRALAIQTFVEKAKSDCSSIEAAVTLVYNENDTPNEDVENDYFKLDVYDGTRGQWLTGIEESITPDESPFYWETGRMDTAAFDGVYNIRLYDTSADGKYERFLESYYYDCKTGKRWWDVEAIDSPGVPSPDCLNTMPVYTTNLAPEDGAIVVTWSWEPSYRSIDYHVDTFTVAAGQAFTYDEFPVPCGVYIRVYFQPNSTKQLYLMPSQYWPYDAYGTSPVEAIQTDEVPIYYTFFPLDGPLRDGTRTPIPFNPIGTRSPGSVLTPVPTSTPLPYSYYFFDLTP